MHQMHCGGSLQCRRVTMTNNFMALINRIQRHVLDVNAVSESIFYALRVTLLS